MVNLPITDMENDKFLLNEVETRLRAEDSDEIILPSVFRPAATQCGLASELDRDLIDHLLHSFEHPNDPHPDESETEPQGWLLPLSASSLTDSDLVEHLQQVIDDKKLDGRKLIIGFREPEVRDHLRELQKFISRFALRGVRFALLDVPLGSRVELMMKNIEISYIKMDNQVAVALSKDKDARDMLRQLVDEANENNTHVIAPQTENTSDLATLWQLGITLVQGQFAHDE